MGEREMEAATRALNILFGPFDANQIGVEKIAKTVLDAAQAAEPRVALSDVLAAIARVKGDPDRTYDESPGENRAWRIACNALEVEIRKLGENQNA